MKWEGIPVSFKFYITVEVKDCAFHKNANQIIKIYCTSPFSRLMLPHSVQKAVCEFLILLHYLSRITETPQ